MAYEAGVAAANQVKNLMAQLADSVVTSLSDKRISAYESMQIALSGTTLATTVMALINEAPEEVRKELVVVLKRAQFVMPE